MSFFFADLRTQAAELKHQIDQHNGPILGAHLTKGGSPNEFIPGVVDFQDALKKLEKRVRRFYGLNSKYDGRGNRRW